MHLNAFYVTCKVPWILAYTFSHHSLLVLSHILMLIDVDVLTLDAPYLGTMFFLVIWCSGPQNDNQLYPGLVLKLSLEVWPTSSLSSVGSTTLLELHFPISKATLVYCDNVSVIYLSGNPVQHQRTKHIKMTIHFVRKRVACGQAQVIKSCLYFLLFSHVCDMLCIRVGVPIS